MSTRVMATITDTGFRTIKDIGQRMLSTMTSAASEDPTFVLEERKIQVDDVAINFVRVGTGDYPVLLLPEALGTIWTSFKSQIENLNKEKFTIVAWEPPGYGKSRPPDRTFLTNYFHRDATWAYGLMKTLGYSNFSLCGIDDGGIMALFLAAKYPEDIRKMIDLGARSYIHPDEMKKHERARDTFVHSEKATACSMQIPDLNYLRQTWSE
ncbi:hypothetical protein DMN91_002574 [Ooceraea biroi]|uniref:AB hydrolase-1 domain-containing protein n=2 Tax=Ooceraea biroi TaxID=2015173 RepID=A0A3L8DWN1_OOCBI|nr:hypothetical protein DMN91_002574 [Ooceraea biroi]